MSQMVFVPQNEEGSGADLESRLNGAFTGFSPGKRFELTNGQVWEQLSVGYLYRFAVMPLVTIGEGPGGRTAMRVQGVPGAVRVRRVR